jgi:2-keto-4-pentenoate hydratase/2-oxohepta-3-ene-1,7-dioic acid hydratase in catechol pathway
MSERWGRVWYADRAWSARIEEDQALLCEGDWLTDAGRVVQSVPLTDVQWLSPVAARTVLCVGRNYREHAAEFDNPVPAEPLFFLKQPGSVIGHQQPVSRPDWVGRVDYEGELVLVIGKPVRRLESPERAREAILGLTVGNDVTARELQRRDGQWTRAKGFDSFAPVGPWVVLGNRTEGRRITTRVNGTVRQDASTDDLIFSCERLIMDASQFMTLERGDLLFTGTPAGVGPVVAGDTVEISVEGVGTLRNSIKNGD